MKFRNTLLNLGAMAALGSSAFGATHVTADITTNTKWTVANSPYILENVIYVKGAILDIEPGVIIRGQPRSSTAIFNPGALVVRPDAKIQARGTVASPIIFTTAAKTNGAGSFLDVVTGPTVDTNGDTVITIADASTPGPDGIPDRWVPADGDGVYYDATPASVPLPAINPITLAKNANMWGGVVIAGDSLTNNGNQVDINGDTILDDGYGIIEGLSGADAIYGGANSEHDGGILKYVSIRHGGAELVTARELNGLTLYAVGSKTTISYVDVYSTGDDGVEIFGGTVNLDHLNISYADDDGFDVDEGWQGLAQFIFILQGQGFGDAGMELDGEDKIESHYASGIPVGDARIYNATVLQNGDADAIAGTTPNGIRMRAGFTGQVVNSILRNFGSVVGGTAYRMDSITGIETEPSARTQFNLGKLQLRNNTAFGYSTAYTAHGPGTGTISITATGAVSGSFAGEALPGAFYQNPLLRTLDTGIVAPNHTVANGVNPRPSLGASAGAYGTTQDLNYVVSPAAFTGYKGAFDRTAATLWTTGWTALNKLGILAN